MKICFLLRAFNPKKREAKSITTRLLTSYLAKNNLVVVVCQHREGLPHYELTEGTYIFRINCGRSGKFYFLNPFGVFKELIGVYSKGIKIAKNKLQINQFDVIVNIFNSPFLGLRTLLLKKNYEKKSKYVSYVKSHSSFNSFFLSPGSYFWTFFLKHCDVVITPLRSIANKLNKGGVQKNKIQIIQSPINIKKFKTKNKYVLCKKYKLNKKQIILYYGHFSNNKGVDYLIKSMRYLNAAKNQNFILILIPSEDNQKNKYKKLISKIDINGQIKILSANSNVVDYLNMADGLCIPYPEFKSTEGNPSCILESFACKTPVITTDFPELREIIIDKKTGILAEAKNPKSISSKIDLLLENPLLGQKIANNAYSISKKFSIENIGKRHQELYKKL